MMPTKVENNKTESNKKIIKNTLFMYFRMLLTMIVNLYTSREILITLGIEDFGIYNIVSGVVVLFTFINSAMSTGTQRHLSYELGKVNGNISKIFSACISIHIIISVIFLFLSETIGLWFLNTQMNFPDERMYIINWIYQFSILGAIANIVRVPYQANIIAHEKMSFYAYTGIVEVTLKLFAVMILTLFPWDKLFIYGFLMLLIIATITIWYILYNLKTFKDIKFTKVHDKYLYKDLLSFSCWTLLGSGVNVGLQQGTNVIINIFYGVTLNAAIGIANQVNVAITQFVNGFQQAVNPQLTKSEANCNTSRQLNLICMSSKLSYLILFLISVPIIVNLNFILDIWLKDYPPLTDSICNLIIIGTLIECLSGPLYTTIFATGKIKIYQIVISIILLLNLPISYYIGSNLENIEYIFILRNIIFILCLLIRIYFLIKLIHFDYLFYFKKVISPIIITSMFVILPIDYFIETLRANSIIVLIRNSVIIIFYELLIYYFIAFSGYERKLLIEHIKNKLIKKKS